MQQVILVGLEHYLADMVHLDYAFQVLPGVQHGEYLGIAVGDHIHEFPKGLRHAHPGILVPHEIGSLQKRQHGLVVIVGEELARLGDAFGIDRVLFDQTDGAEGEGG